MTNALTKKSVITAAQEACKSLSRCRNFFNFEENSSWLGWENWLTVDIARRLDHKAVVRFGTYLESTTRSDIQVRGKPPIAVEVKVNYVDNSELDASRKRGSRKLPHRVTADLQKLDRNCKFGVRLMLVAIAFETKARQVDYRELLKHQLENTLGGWRRQWKEAGTILLLAMYKDTPERHNFSVERMAAGGACLQIRALGARRHRSPRR